MGISSICIAWLTLSVCDHEQIASNTMCIGYIHHLTIPIKIAILMDAPPSISHRNTTDSDQSSNYVMSGTVDGGVVADAWRLDAATSTTAVATTRVMGISPNSIHVELVVEYATPRCVMYYLVTS